MSSENICKELGLQPDSLYEVNVKCSQFNLEHRAFLFVGFLDGGYCYVYNNSYEYPVRMHDCYSIEVLWKLASLNTVFKEE
jgi:hypothetical protein